MKSRCWPTISLPARGFRKNRIPVATGENNYTRYEFRELIERRAARYLMPDVCRANGYSETLRIGRLAAAARGRRFAARGARALAARRRRARQRLSRRVHRLDAARLFEEMPPCKDGHFQIPRRSGHGMALAKGAIEKYRKQRIIEVELHLS